MEFSTCVHGGRSLEGIVESGVAGEVEMEVPFGMALLLPSFDDEGGVRVDCASLKCERRELVNSVFDFSKVGRRGRIEGAVFMILLDLVS